MQFNELSNGVLLMQIDAAFLEMGLQRLERSLALGRNEIVVNSVKWIDFEIIFTCAS